MREPSATEMSSPPQSSDGGERGSRGNDARWTYAKCVERERRPLSLATSVGTRRQIRQLALRRLAQGCPYYGMVVDWLTARPTWIRTVEPGSTCWPDGTLCEITRPSFTSPAGTLRK